MPLPARQMPTRPGVKPFAPKPNIRDRIKPMGFEEDQGLKILLYGKSGTGKTTLWSTFPGPILCVVCSGGNNPGELRSVDTEENRRRISQFVLEKTGDLEEIVKIAAEDGFKTIVIDHVTGLQDLALKEVLGLDEAPVQKTWGMARQEDYGTCVIRCKELLRKVLNLSMNVVLIAHERSFNTKDDGEAGTGVNAPFIAAGLMPSFVQWVNGAVDYICQAFIRQQTEVKVTKVGKTEVATDVPTGKVEYCLRVAADPIVMVKFRTPRRDAEPPQALVNPTYDQIKALTRAE